MYTEMKYNKHTVTCPGYWIEQYTENNCLLSICNWMKHQCTYGKASIIVRTFVTLSWLMWRVYENVLLPNTGPDLKVWVCLLFVHVCIFMTDLKPL
jgi:hypothetical protein